ncbi:MAG TPA: mechanosensitive ion channel family protein [Pirellulales bacterium]|jgi:small-conductance mechanosensitive channel|nr:mechanosensitive ion channel family protein [Pirellulales bacterium]
MDWQKLWQDFDDSPLVRHEFAGNALPVWLIAAAAFITATFVLRLVVAIVRKRAQTIAERRNSDLARAVAGLATATKWWFLLIVSLFLASLVLKLHQRQMEFMKSAAIIALLVQAAVWSDVLIRLFIERYMQRRMESDAASVTMMSALGFLGRMATWVLATLLILENLGVEVSALVAGLGVGGVAVALAAQNVLGDLFASLSIVLDKPFILGDFIAVGDFLGSVEHIGLKTTRLRSLSGEQLVFSNNDLLQGRIRNYKRMFERRIQFSLGVEYSTPPDQVAAIPGMIREAIVDQGKTRFDRAHFKSFGDSALLYEAVYYVLSPDYNLYMDIQQAINLTLVRRFASEEIQFAFPTQTLYVHKADGAPSAS